MTNPFENSEATYYVLVNADGQHSLWPGYIEAPGGWTVAYGPSDRAGCLEYTRKEWTDLRPVQVGSFTEGPI